jgi:hypothetical protein
MSGPFGDRARASADEAVDSSAARGAELQHRVRHLLALIKTRFTRIAKVFVGGHRLSLFILRLPGSAGSICAHRAREIDEDPWGVLNWASSSGCNEFKLLGPESAIRSGNLSSETVVLLAGVIAEALVLALLSWRREYRWLPMFYIYIVWGVVSDCSMPVLHWRFPNAYVGIFLTETSLDSLLQYGGLVELAWSVLRPFHALPPRRVLPVTALGVLAGGVLAWPFSVMPGTARMVWNFVLIGRVQETFAILRVVFFLVLAIASHWLSIGWRNRELQVATGLGLYSLGSLVGTLAHQYQAVRTPNYHRVDLAIAASYVGSLAYWLVCFAQKEPPRPDLPEHAQNILLELAGTAHGQRVTLEMRRGGRNSDLE